VLPEGTRVTLVPGRPKERTVHKVAVAGLSNPVIVHNNSLVNLVRGLAERVFNVEVAGRFQPPPKARDGAYARLDQFKRRVVAACPSTTRVSYTHFVSLYSGRKASIYANAVATLMVRAIRKADSYLSTFVKAEKVIPTITKPDPCPRVIQPRSPRYNVEVGRFLKCLEKPLCKAIDYVWGETVIMKGLTVEGVATQLRKKWERFGRPVAIGADASRFDQHVGGQALRWEHSVYTSLFHGTDRRDLKRLLSWQLLNKGWARAADGVVKYVVEGCRMSGDMNTSLGNCLLMCALMWQYCSERGIDASLANNGDDCVIFMDESDVERFGIGFSEWFLDFGFTMVVEAPVRIFERIEFCRQQPVWCGDAWVMVRTVLPALNRDLTTILSVQSLKQAQQWLYAIGVGGQSITWGVPIFQAFYEKLVRLGVESKVQDSPWLADSGFMRLRSNRVRQEITPEARVSFWLAFGVTPDEQMALEKDLDPTCCWAPGVSSTAGTTYNILLTNTNPTL
jgi:hypothetical protein